MVLLIILVKFLVLITYSDAMTMKQIRNTGKMIRKTCLPKTNVDEEKIDKISEGVFNEEKEVMCYTACVMKMVNTFKNGKFNYDSAMKQADMLLPDEIKEPAKATLTACKKVQKIDKISEGVFNEEKEVMCYSACVMKMANTGKNYKFNYDSAMKQADMLLPDEIKEPAKATLMACKKVPDAYKDPCEGSFHLAKCLQKENPAIFYFP